MVDAACGRNISGDSVDRLPVHYECPAGMGAGYVGSKSGLAVCAECLVLDDGDIQAMCLGNGDDSDLAFALGKTIAKKSGRFGTLKTILSQIV